MKTIIAPYYQHDALSRIFLKQQAIITNISLIPLQHFLDNIHHIDYDDYHQQINERIKNISEQLIILKPYSNQDSFIQNIKEFYLSMHLHDITIDMLPKISRKDQELLIVFNSMEGLTPPEMAQLTALNDYLDVTQLSDIVLTQQTITSDYLQFVYNLLLDRGIELLDEKPCKPKHIELYSSNNIRTEVESVAQLIINQNLLTDCLIVPLHNDYNELINQVFMRYNIPFTQQFQFNNNTVFNKFKSIITLLKNRNNASINQFISSNPFDFLDINDVLTFINYRNMDLSTLLTYQHLEFTDNILHQRDIETYNHLSSKTEIFSEQLLAIIGDWLDNDNLTMLQNVFNYLLENNNYPELNQIKRILLDKQDIIRDSNDLSETINHLLTNIISTVAGEGIVITNSSSHNFLSKKHVIVVGMTSTNFPQVNTLTGIIDERYVADLPYPKKEERFSQLIDEQKQILNADNLYLFFPQSDYMGKSIEPSFEMLNLAAQHGIRTKRYPLIENDYSEYRKYSIAAATAKQLFFKDNTLIGSVSSFENYNNCHYQYFISRGLNIYPKSMPELNRAYIGSIIHLIMKTIIDKYGKDYPLVDKRELAQLVNNSFDNLKPLMDDSRLQLISRLFINQLSETLKIMKEAELNTSFAPSETEYAFEHLLQGDNYHILLRGSIDRIDSYNNYLRIIDYKSSLKTLSPSAFMQGMQLQLLTYLMVAAQKLDKIPTGTFYQTIKASKINTTAATVKKTNERYYPNDDASDVTNYMKHNSLNGWHFNDVGDAYNNDIHVGGLKESEDGVIVRGKPYNYETVIDVLHELYRDIYQSLLSGDIDCVPIDNPCRFCEYHSICLSKTTQNKRPSVMNDINLKEAHTDVDN